MVTITADSSTNTSETMSFENNSSLRDDSFSSYSNEAEDTFVLQLEESSRHLNSFPSIPQKHVHLGRKKTEYGEIHVYGAEEYFNGEVDEGIPKVVYNSATGYQNNKDDPLEIRSLKTKTRPGTPGGRSELGWNSRSSLLQIPRNQQSKKVNNTRVRSFLARLGCNCSCNDKESVNVDNYTHRGKAKEPLKNGNLSHVKKSHSDTWLKEDRQGKRFDEARRVYTPDDISFPEFNSKTGIANKLHSLDEEKDTRRKSPEVFGSPIMTKGEKSLSPERRIARISWDAIPPREVGREIPASSNGKYNDTDSDASSDLFEIESFSTNANPYLARQGSDGMSSCVTPRTCYVPSEASIEWSTVTASAADFSVMSDRRELKTTSTETSLHINVLDGKNITGKEMPERCPRILSGCKGQKSVRVAGETYRTSDKAFPSHKGTKDWSL